MIEINLDHCLSNLSMELLKIDQVSRNIMVNIAQKGPLTVYQIHRLTKSRPSIYRRLRGVGRFVGLLKEDYMSKELTAERLPTGHWKSAFGLRFKGILASLSEVELDQTYFGIPFFNDVVSRSGDKEIRQISKNYIKSEVSLWMQLHKENGLLLTHVKNGEQWYRSSRNFLFSLSPPLWIGADGELCEEFSDNVIMLKATVDRWACALTDKLNSFEAEINKQLFYEIGDWPQYMRLLHQIGKDRVDKYLSYDKPSGNPNIICFPQFRPEFRQPQ